MALTIYEFDKDNDFIKRIDADYADISSKNWKLKNIKIIDLDGNILSENIPEITYKSIYDINKIKSLYSNLDTVSFWDIKSEIKLLKNGHLIIFYQMPMSLLEAGM